MTTFGPCNSCSLMSSSSKIYEMLGPVLTGPESKVVLRQNGRLGDAQNDEPIMEKPAAEEQGGSNDMIIRQQEQSDLVRVRLSTLCSE
ncbi:hypothetical protein U9M48_021362 [Paspalum notatum var. saurae]|uniref:Uncharacterized protein n=1 Tax=Paspalum notatum var. saurae TaxID=547442 RepID=A0AAQ3WSU8_PASNO